MSSCLSIDERVKIIELITSCQSIVVTQRKFRTYCEKKDAQTRKSIERIVGKFKDNNSVRTNNLERQDDEDQRVNSVITTRMKHLLKSLQD